MTEKSKELCLKQHRSPGGGELWRCQKPKGHITICSPDSVPGQAAAPPKNGVTRLPAPTFNDVLNQLSAMAERLGEDEGMALDYAVEQLKVLAVPPSAPGEMDARTFRTDPSSNKWPDSDFVRYDDVDFETVDAFAEAYAAQREAPLRERIADFENQIKYANDALGGNPSVYLHDRIFKLRERVRVLEEAIARIWPLGFMHSCEQGEYLIMMAADVQKELAAIDTKVEENNAKTSH